VYKVRDVVATEYRTASNRRESFSCLQGTQRVRCYCYSYRQSKITFLHSYLQVFVDSDFGILRILVKLQKILALLCKTTWEETWEETLDSTKNEYVPDRGERDDQNDNYWNESNDIFEGPPEQDRRIAVRMLCHMVLLLFRRDAALT
jgi:hypothetical protein